MSGKKEIPLCDPYVWEDPRYLFRSSWLDRYLNRRRGVCASELVNEIIFVYVFSILCGIVASVATNLSSAPLIAGLAATVYLIPTFLKLRDVEGFRIQFQGSESVAKDSDDPDSLLKEARAFKGEPVGLTESFEDSGTPSQGVVGAPTNPFNNVLISEIAYAPTRPAAPDSTSPEARIALDDFFRVQWYSDPTDVFGKSQSQREFVTQPSTTIPNDQGSYQDWLYKIPGKTCKEGNPAACYGGTEGAALPWLNNNY
jgi:hypothetical protein